MKSDLNNNNFPVSTFEVQGVGLTSFIRAEDYDVDAKLREMHLGRELCGFTAFYRFPAFQDALIEYLGDHKPSKNPQRILIAPGSIGCEAATMAMLADQRGLDVRVDSIDISQLFTDHAREGLYPAKSLDSLPQRLKDYFKAAGERVYAAGLKPEPMVRLGDIQDRVTILPNSDLLDLHTDEPYDAVLCLNLFQHIRPPKEKLCLEKLASLSRGLVCVNAMSHDPSQPDHPFTKAGLQEVPLPGYPYIKWERNNRDRAPPARIRICAIIPKG